MNRFLLCVSLLLGLFFVTGCEDGSASSTQVRFENNSNKMVYAVWDGARTETLAPGQRSDYRDVNPGRHTLMWKNAANNKILTSMAWPSLVEGQRYTFPYN